MHMIFPYIEQFSVVINVALSRL